MNFPANTLRFPTLLHGLLHQVAERPDALAYRVIADDERIGTATWAEFLDLVRRCATLFGPRR